MNESQSHSFRWDPVGGVRCWEEQEGPASALAGTHHPLKWRAHLQHEPQSWVIGLNGRHIWLSTLSFTLISGSLERAAAVQASSQKYRNVTKTSASLELSVSPSTGARAKLLHLMVMGHWPLDWLLVIAPSGWWKAHRTVRVQQQGLVSAAMGDPDVRFKFDRLMSWEIEKNILR